MQSPELGQRGYHTSAKEFQLKGRNDEDKTHIRSGKGVTSQGNRVPILSYKEGNFLKGVGKPKKKKEEEIAPVI